MALTLLVVVESQFPRVRHDIGMSSVSSRCTSRSSSVWPRSAAPRLDGFEAPAARALLFTGATRNSLVVLPLALALGEDYALTAAVIVTQTVVEVLGMVVYVRVVPRLVPAARQLRAD